MRNAVLAGLVGAFMLTSGVAYAAKPERNVSAKRHPNIAAAQRLANQAFQKIVAAQKANEYDMEGHAQKAKELLEQASAELKEAAEAANKNAK
jgi:F0F1-type ATP synthase membrane subunit b/b'